MKETILIKVVDRDDFLGYTASCKLKGGSCYSAHGDTLAEAVEKLKTTIAPLIGGDDHEFMVRYFGGADLQSVFLSDEGGITASSANYLANLAQEVIQEKKVGMENISFLNSKIVTPLCPDGLEYEKANFNLKKLEQTIDEIAKFNTFCAWVREGIKAKEEALNAVEKIDFGTWLRTYENEMPNDPIVRLYLTDSSIIGTELNGTPKVPMTMGEKFNMLKAEALASTYGKLIHMGTPISNARKELQTKTVNPVKMEGSGQDLTLYKYEPAVSVEEVDATFMRLQNRQREAEKELNHIKAQVTQMATEAKIKSLNQFGEAQNEYRCVRAELTAKYKAEMESVREYVNSLKIILPDSLKETFQYLNNLGK